MKKGTNGSLFFTKNLEFSCYMGANHSYTGGKHQSDGVGGMALFGIGVGAPERVLEVLDGSILLGISGEYSFSPF